MIKFKPIKNADFVPACSTLFQQGWNTSKHDYIGFCVVLFQCSITFLYIAIFFITEFILRLYFHFMFFFLANIVKKVEQKENLNKIVSILPTLEAVPYCLNLWNKIKSKHRILGAWSCSIKKRRCGTTWNRFFTPHFLGKFKKGKK